MAPAEAVHHPLFARVFARVSARAEERGQGEHRRELLSGLSGRVIEVGAGNGLTSPSTPQAWRRSSRSSRRTTCARWRRRRPRRLRCRSASSTGWRTLSRSRRTFDAGVASLVLCSVPEQAAALGELYRVIRPGGELRFYEHVIAAGEPLAPVQRIADRSGIWPLVAGGCHAGRDTAGAIELAGFEIESCRRFRFRPGLVEFLAAPKILGVARRPEATP